MPRFVTLQLAPGAPSVTCSHANLIGDDGADGAVDSSQQQSSGNPSGNLTRLRPELVTASVKSISPR
jgi:hypothetical protein